MSNTPSNLTSNIAEFSKQKQAYLENFQKYLSHVPDEHAFTLANLSLDDEQPQEADHVYKDSLGCRLDDRPEEDFDAEEAHLKKLVAKFSNKLPYLNDWLAAFQERRTRAEIMPSNKEDETTGRKSPLCFLTCHLAYHLQLLLTALFSIDLTDQVAKESSSSTASDHHSHDVNTGAKEGSDTGHMKATAQDHSATPVSATTLKELGTWPHIWQMSSIPLRG